MNKDISQTDAQLTQRLLQSISHEIDKTVNALMYIEGSFTPLLKSKIEGPLIRDLQDFDLVIQTLNDISILLRSWSELEPGRPVDITYLKNVLKLERCRKIFFPLDGPQERETGSSSAGICLFENNISS